MDQVRQAQRSRIMAEVKSEGNRSTELRLVALFHAQHITGWRRHYALQGNPDFVFPKARVALFVDGCFWHGCGKHCRMPHSHRRYWTAKIASNKARDRETNRALRKNGWRVLRLWEHELQGTKQSRRLMTLCRNRNA